MENLNDLGRALATYRQSIGLKQGDVAKQSGISQELLSRFERGRVSEFGSRKLLAVLNTLKLEMIFHPINTGAVAAKVNKTKCGHPKKNQGENTAKIKTDLTR